MEKIKVLLALITRDNDYQREQASSAEAAAKRLGIDLRVVYADGDAIAQTQQALAAIRAPEPERPDVIMVEPVGTSMVAVARNAIATGIGWILINRDPDEILPLRKNATVPVAAVHTDNVEVGRIQGRQFGALLPSGGAVLYIEGPAADVARQRRAGMQETLPGNIEVKTVRGKWTEESAFHAVESRLQLQWSQAPNVGIIGCQNDAMAMGARKAVEALPDPQKREQWLKLPFTGCDGVTTSGQVWVRRGLLTATVITPALTGLALELLAKAVSSRTQMAEGTTTKPTSFPSIEELTAKSSGTRDR